MKRAKIGIRSLVLILGTISIVVVVLDLVFLNFYADILFKEPRVFTAIEVVVIIGAFVLAAFILFSVKWVYALEQIQGRWTPGKVFTIGYGATCFLILFMEKVMADKVGRQMLAGDAYDFQLNVLQMLFILQLIYSLLIITELQAQDEPETLLKG